MASASPSPSPPQILASLSSTVLPATLPNPPPSSRRASIALILRRSASPPYSSPLSSLDLLFIKRAPRVSDRWTGHIAFPGGKRDPEDASDEACAEREVWEEVGIDLRAKGQRVGGLTQRVVTDESGLIPVMVLCPYVYFLHDSAAGLALQESEVASAHWVSLERVLASEARIGHASPVRSWLVPEVVRRVLRMSLEIVYPAILLRPLKSLYASYVPEEERVKQRLELWGITLGVTGDFMDEVVKGAATAEGRPEGSFGTAGEELRIWFWPTFKQWDLRILLALVSWRFRRRKEAVEDEKQGAEAKMAVRSESIPRLLLGYDSYVAATVVISAAMRTIGAGWLVWKILLALRRYT